MNDSMVVLGGGIAALSFAYFYNSQTVLLEREAVVGGLCRSFKLNNIAYDIGPHIIFSKHDDILDLHNSLIDVDKIKRSNKILYQGRLVKYPFENDLSALSDSDRDYCLTEFLNNPYEEYNSANMQQFFLKTFGEGITRLYLQPYNEKIWKFDPVFLDTQMVDRIPKPPKDDVIKSARGVVTEGYIHQLYFTYPKEGGFQTLVDAYVNKISDKAKIFTSTNIQKLYKENDCWVVESNKGLFKSKTIISCIPLHELFKYLNPPANIKTAIDKLKYNSIHIITLQLKKDNIGDNFALYVPDKDIIFHRISKLNFLGPAYCLPNGGTTLLLEVTFRPGSYLGELSTEDIINHTLNSLERVAVANRSDVIDVEIRTFKYAYVIYDLEHRKNTDIVLSYLKEQNIFPCGRFAEFEYLNSDQVVYRSKQLAENIVSGRNE